MLSLLWCVFQGIGSDPSIGLANTVTKSGEPNSSDTFQDSAVEMDDAVFRGESRVTIFVISS